MSFFAGGNVRVGLSIQGLNEAISGAQNMTSKSPQAKMSILREASSFFVLKAKERVHKISGNLARSISVDSITPEQAIVSAKMPYAATEENRSGNRKIPPGTQHTYMRPAAVDTNAKMPDIIRKHYSGLLMGRSTTFF